MSFSAHYPPEKIRNVAIIAHVDHGKTTLVDAMIRQSGLFRENQRIQECFMDSNAIERERGITILAKNLSLGYLDHKINVVDTPGHVDFGGEVERVLQMVNGCLLVVDSFEGPMPQTRFVLRKALNAGLRPIVVVNKIDRPDARPEQVVDEVLDLFIDVGADESILDYPVLFASGRDGYACASLGDPRNSIRPLLDAIVHHVPPPTGQLDAPGSMLVTSLDYNDYVGRIGIGRIFSGRINAKSDVFLISAGKPLEKGKIAKLYTFQGVQRVETAEASAGDLIAIAGLPTVSIGHTVATAETVEPLPVIPIDQPVISMTFSPNVSPFSGRDGNMLTSRQIWARLQKELESNVALRVETTESPDTFLVSGRGELHLGILIENMRREGFELEISRPKAIMKHDANGTLLEPIEELTLDIPETYMGPIMEVLGPRRAILSASHRLAQGGIRLVFTIPARSLIGFRNQFLTMTNGTGILNQGFFGYEPYRGDIPGRRVGVMVAMEDGTTTGYAIRGLEERGVLFCAPGQEIYTGMIVGECPRDGDMNVNVVRAKHLTNHRSSTQDIVERLTPPRLFSLDQALEYITDDELVEVTPNAVRMRKRTSTYKRRG